jgi:hypothetical protein
VLPTIVPISAASGHIPLSADLNAPRPMERAAAQLIASFPRWSAQTAVLASRSTFEHDIVDKIIDRQQGARALRGDVAIGKAGQVVRLHTKTFVSKYFGDPQAPAARFR